MQHATIVFSFIKVSNLERQEVLKSRIIRFRSDSFSTYFILDHSLILPKSEKIPLSRGKVTFGEIAKRDSGNSSLLQVAGRKHVLEWLFG